MATLDGSRCLLCLFITLTSNRQGSTQLSFGWVKLILDEKKLRGGETDSDNLGATKTCIYYSRLTHLDWLQAHTNKHKCHCIQRAHDMLINT